MRAFQTASMVLIIIALLIYSVRDGVPESAEVAQQKKGVMLVLGEYLRSDYVESIRTNLSPMRSYLFSIPQLVKVQEGETGLLLQPIFNFHEGGPDFILGKDGSVVVQIGAGYDTSNLLLEVHDANHFKLGFDKFKPTSYIFVGDAGRYVATIVLAGEYTDVQGQLYVFGTDGWAIFPDRKFEYQVGLDHILNQYDYFDDRTSNKVYAFKRRDRVLEIFGTSGDINQFVDERPILSLKQKTSKK